MSDAPILLIDLAHLVHSYWHLSADQADPNWTSMQALGRVRALASGHAHVAICSEGGRSFRKAIDATYKANRPEKNEPLLFQMTRTEDLLRADGYPVWRAETFEADDVIATAARLAIEADAAVLIASHDKDLLQLVCPVVSVLSTKTDVIFDDAAVQGKFGVHAAQMRDYLALVGDTSDNIKGAPGIGPKKAADLLAQFGTLDGIMDAATAGQLTNGTAKSLIEHSLQITRARQLVTLRTDAPIPFADIFSPRVPVTRKDTMTETLDAPEAVLAETTADLKPEATAQPATSAPDETGLARVTPAVVVNDADYTRQLEPRTLGDARVLAKWAFESTHFSAYANPQAVMGVILAGRELGLGAMASLRGFHVIKNRVTMAADLMRALVLSSGKADYFLCKERTPTTSTWITKRKGDPSETSLTFTFEEAKRAGLVSPGSGWEKHQADMVAKTASAKLCRLVYADLLFGMYAAEEMGGDA